MWMHARRFHSREDPFYYIGEGDHTQHDPNTIFFRGLEFSQALRSERKSSGMTERAWNDISLCTRDPNIRGHFRYFSKPEPIAVSIFSSSTAV